ncbi:hypothetical protein OOT46_30030 [Aquabacterium sp. A7-Y]|uniref:hypothetical protein n=1 Tax=Aquabacterium sp. A7-Y TaxID=1349605 RepID=UPI00223CF6C2|nr:hypothetical protein [Aquabacterium sp. A7-Y]MCW7542038.1 hypothetical protein [Aquabacterium sp. A7-Y]
MLSSLFGDLAPPTDPREARRAAHTADFAATAMLESVATEVNDRGQIIDKHTSDLFVVGSPSEAIRQHLASTRADLGLASRQITLFDPGRMWASSVIKALSEASGQPVERLRLRHQNTLATIATIERTALPRRVDEPLKIYHTDVRDLSSDAQAIPIALMASSHLTAVVLTPVSAAALDEMLNMLLAATRGADWRCPNLLFMLCDSAAKHAPRIASNLWPTRLNVMVTTEPMTSASGVWNSVLGSWNQVKKRPQWEARQPATALGETEFPIKVADLGLPVIGRVASGEKPGSAAPNVVQVDTRRRPVPDATRLERTLEQLMSVEGMLGCCVVDGGSGLVLAGRTAADASDLNLELAAATQTEVMKAHRRAARETQPADRIDEIIVTQSRRHQVLRTVAAHAELFLLAVLDKQRTNLALARFKILDADKSLA